MGPVPFERCFPGLQKLVKIFLWRHQRGQNLGQRSPKISRFCFSPKWPYFDPSTQKMKNFTIFSSFRGKIYHCTRKKSFYARKMLYRKFDIFWTLRDEKNFTFWAITPVLVGIFQICLHIWKLEKKLKTGGADRFFLPSRQSGQNRARRSKFWITRFWKSQKLKIGPPDTP